MLVVAIVNQKGGVGKTTTAVTLGHGLALLGYRVLVVDLDSQGHVAEALGLEKTPGLYEFINSSHPRRALVKARSNLWIVPGDKTTAVLKKEMVAMPLGGVFVLDDKLQEMGGSFDIAILDTAPSIDILQTNALLAADYLLVPTRLDHLALDGVNDVLKSLAQLKRGLGRRVEVRCRLLAVLPTFYDRQTRETRVLLDKLIERFGHLVWPPIPVDTKLREAPAYGRTIWEYAPGTRAVKGVQGRNGSFIGGYDEIRKRVKEVLDGRRTQA